MQALLIFCAGGILGYSLLLQRGTSELSSEYGAAAATNTISLLNAHSRGTDNVNDPSSGEWLGYAIENGRRIIPEVSKTNQNQAIKYKNIVQFVAWLSSLIVPIL